MYSKRSTVLPHHASFGHCLAVIVTHSGNMAGPDCHAHIAHCDGQRRSAARTAILAAARVERFCMIWWNGKIPEIERLTRLGSSSMPAHLGIEFVDCGEDWVKARMPVDHRTHQPFGRLHGGASVALAETIGSMGGAMVVDPEKFVTVGLEINANHVRPVREGWVYATARPEALGRTTHVWSIRIEDEADRLVCVSRLTLAVISIDRS